MRLLFSVLVSASVAAAQWVVQNRNLGTIVMGCEFFDETTGRFGGAIDGAGPAVWYTQDGGVTLEQEVDDPFALPGIVFDIASQGNTSVCGGLGGWWGLLGPGSAYTNDNGQSWQSSDDQFWLTAAYQSVEQSEGIYFLTGIWYNFSTSGAIEGYGVAVSSDGGATYDFHNWGIPGTPPSEYPESPRYGSFLSSQVGFIAGGHWPLTAQTDVLGLKGANFAASQFVRLPVDEKIAERAQPAFTGYRAVVAKTVDGGVTWTVLYDVESDYYFNQISMTNSTHGCAVAEGGNAYVLCTSDGGYTWDITLTVTGGSLVAIDFADESYVVVGGADLQGGINAAFWESYDAGRTWTRMPTTDAAFHFVFNLSVPSRTTAYAVALNLGNSSSTMKYTA